MAQPSKNKANSSQTGLKTSEDTGLSEMLSQVVTLAREARYEGANDSPQQFLQNFARVIRVSGSWLLAGDAIAALSAFLLGGIGAWALDTYVLRGDFQDLMAPAALNQFAIFAGLGAISLLWFDTKGHYRQRLPYWEAVGHILTAALVGGIVAGFSQFASKADHSRLWLILSWSLFAAFILMGRGLVRRWLESRGSWQVPTVIIGQGPTAQAAKNALLREREMGFSVVETVPAEALDKLSQPKAWRRLLMSCGARYVFIALEGSQLEAQQAALKCLTRERLPCSIVPPWLGLPSSTLSPHHFMMSDVMLLHDTNQLTLPLPSLLKRAFDITMASLALAAVLPLFAIVTLVIRRDGGPAFFKQARVGRNGKFFNCYKFRSMHINAEELLKQCLTRDEAAAAEWAQYQKLKNDVRVTKFGDFIRRTSIDELPQLINVLKGEMSLVGPRPIMQGQEDFYADDFVYYSSVRPGITGPWQVSGRNKLTFKERVSLECWYARNWSLWMDIVIILKTIPTLLKKGQAF